MSKSCPKFQFEITYSLKISYCKNCEGMCLNNKILLGAIEPSSLGNFPIDMLDDFTDETRIMLEEIMNNDSRKGKTELMYYWEG
jgi:hypothetical protein